MTIPLVLTLGVCGRWTCGGSLENASLQSCQGILSVAFGRSVRRSP